MNRQRVYVNDDRGKRCSTKIVNFMTSRIEVVLLGCVHIGNVVKMLNFI